MTKINILPDRNTETYLMFSLIMEKDFIPCKGSFNHKRKDESNDVSKYLKLPCDKKIKA